MATNQALEAMRRVCMNECFSTSREMYEDLGLLARAVCEGQMLPGDVNRFLSRAAALPRQRALYLLELLQDHMHEDVRAVWSAWFGEGGRSPQAGSWGPFFHGDTGRPQTNDALAVRYGFSRGVEMSKLLQLLSAGVA